MAFQSVSKASEKSNLFVFLTPHVIGNPAEAEEIYKNKKETWIRLKRAELKCTNGIGINLIPTNR